MDGCILTATSHTITDYADNDLVWGSEISFGTETFLGSPASQLLIPSGVTEVEVFAGFGMSVNSSASCDTHHSLLLNGTIFRRKLFDDMLWSPFCMRTGPMTVSSGDYFEQRFRNYVAAAGTASPTFTYLGCIVDPTEKLRGVVSVSQDSDTSVSTTATEIVWGTPDLDTLSTHGSPATDFIVPADTEAAVVSAIMDTTGTTTVGLSTMVLRKNGSAVRRCLWDNQNATRQQGTWLIDVSEGDVLSLAVAHSNSGLTSQAAGTDFSIEWYG